MLARDLEPIQSQGDVEWVDIPLVRRIRQSPYSALARAHGASAWTIYNHMLLPTAFAGVEEDYHHLKRAVQVWDVAAERQIEITGPDADTLVQLMTPRRVHDAEPLKCLYAPVCDADGGILNDPLMVKPEPGRWWVSVADSDTLLFARGLAAGRGLRVHIDEPDVHPLAVQGPLADALMERVFGSEVTKLRFFRAGRFEALGASHVVARCGWSGQGGFEIFVEGIEHCAPIWSALFEAGADLDVRAGCPNGIERIEAGLLSYGNDITAKDDPYQCGLGRYVDPETDCLARKALAERREPTRRLRGLVVEGDARTPPLVRRWRISRRDGRDAGHVTSMANSPDHGCPIGIAMMAGDAAETGTEVLVDLPDGSRRAARVHDLPLKP